MYSPIITDTDEETGTEEERSTIISGRQSDRNRRGREWKRKDEKKRREGKRREKGQTRHRETAGEERWIGHTHRQDRGERDIYTTHIVAQESGAQHVPQSTILCLGLGSV